MRLSLCLAIALIAKVPAAAQQKQVELRKWEHETSDLPVDPIFHFGHLKNGVRYAWLAIKQPPKRVFLRLHVNVGSLVEQDVEQGIAHFVEHMAFNGTKNFQAGTLVEFLQAQGMKFGNDVNAHTGFDETVYELELPDADVDRFKKALSVLRDDADGILLQEKEVQKEKGVIDAEERDRAAGAERFRKIAQDLIPGSRYATRLPIGIKEIRQKFNSHLCMTFYRHWYRPEQMTVIVAGDLGALDPAPLIEAAFASIPVPRDPPPARPDAGVTLAGPRGVCFHDPEEKSVEITIARVHPAQEPPDNGETRSKDIPLQAAREIVRRRLVEIGKKGAPWEHATCSRFDFQEVLDGDALQIQVEPEKWKEAVGVAEKVLRKAIEQGFSDKELEDAYTEEGQKLVTMPHERLHALHYVAELERAAGHRYVPMEDKASKEVLRPGMRNIDRENCAKALSQAWNQGELLITSSGKLDLGADANKVLLAAWNDSRKEPLDRLDKLAAPTAETGATAKSDPKSGSKPDAKPDAKPDPKPDGGDHSTKPEGEKPKDKKPAPFAYPSSDAMGEIESTKKEDDLKITRVTFKNGVRAIFKYTDFEQALVRVDVRVGQGELDVDPADLKVAWLADRVFLECGLGKNEWSDVAAHGGGAMGFDVGGDSLAFHGFTTGDGLLRECELICAYLTDPGWRSDAFDKFVKEDLPKDFEAKPEIKDFESAVRKLMNDVQAVDPRFAKPDRAAVESVTLEDVKRFLQPQLADGPIEITIVGGAYPEKVQKALGRTFAKLPSRRAPLAADRRPKPVKLATGLKQRHEIEGDEKSALIYIVFPATDGIDPLRREQLSFLDDVVSDRLRVEIREKRSATYSPRTRSEFDETYPGLGTLALEMTVDPPKVDDLTKACFYVTDQLAKSGVKQDEIDRIRQTYVTSFQDHLRRNDFWMRVLREAHRRPEALDEVRDPKPLWDRVKAEDVSALCKKILVRTTASVCTVVPKKK